MAIQISAKEAARLGITDAGTPVRKRTTRRALPAGKTPVRCHTCGELLVGETATVGHMEATGHHRYECLIGPG